MTARPWTPGEVKLAADMWAAENRERRREYDRACYQQHAEERRAYARAYYATHREEICARDRERYRAKKLAALKAMQGAAKGAVG